MHTMTRQCRSASVRLSQERGPSSGFFVRFNAGPWLLFNRLSGVNSKILDVVGLLSG